MRIGDFGPFASGVLGAMIPAGLIIALAAGLRVQLPVVLWMLVPGMSLATFLIAVSMGWMFILIGRLKRQPRWIPGTMLALGIAMLELLTLVILIERAG
jgi:hypothetical protein